MVALILVITSAPNGWLLVQRGLHAGRRAGGQVQQGGHHRGGAQVEGDAEPPGGVSPGSTAISTSSTTHRGDLEVRLAQRAAKGL